MDNVCISVLILTLKTGPLCWGLEYNNTGFNLYQEPVEQELGFLKGTSEVSLSLKLRQQTKICCPFTNLL